MRIASTVLSLVTIFLLLATPGAAVIAQDAEGPAAEQDGSAEEAGVAAADEEAPDAEADAEDDGDEGNDALDDLDNPDFADLDEQTYEEDDDDFVPTEEVPADEAIPFPSDI